MAGARHHGMYFVPWGRLPFDIAHLVQAKVGALPSFLILVAATVAGCWLFYWIGRTIGWLRPLIGLQRT